MRSQLLAGAGFAGLVNAVVNVSTPAGYTGPTYLGTASINAPYDVYGFDTYMGGVDFNSTMFDAQLCADACSKASARAITKPPSDGSPAKTCQYFNTYQLLIASTNRLQGQYCALYSETWPAQYATNKGLYLGHDHYIIANSVSFSNASNPGAASSAAAIHQAGRDISFSSLQPFCSNLLGYTTSVSTTTATATSAPSTLVTDTSSPSTVVVITSSPATTITVAISTSEVTVFEKRSAGALSTPSVLTKYPTGILSAACSLQATPVTWTSVVSTTVTTTLPVSTDTTLVTLSTSTILTTTTLSSTSTSTVDVVVTATTTAAAQVNGSQNKGAVGNVTPPAQQPGHDTTCGIGKSFAIWNDYNGAYLQSVSPDQYESFAKFVATDRESSISFYLQGDCSLWTYEGDFPQALGEPEGPVYFTGSEPLSGWGVYCNIDPTSYALNCTSKGGPYSVVVPGLNNQWMLVNNSSPGEFEVETHLTAVYENAGPGKNTGPGRNLGP